MLIKKQTKVTATPLLLFSWSSQFKSSILLSAVLWNSNKLWFQANLSVLQTPVATIQCAEDIVQGLNLIRPQG